LKLPFSFYVLLSYIVGLFIGRYHFDIILISLFILTLLIIFRKNLFLVPFLILVLILGVVLYNANLPKFQLFEKKWKSLEGIVEEKILRKDVDQIIFRPYFSKERGFFYLKGNNNIKEGDILYLENVSFYPINFSNPYNFWDDNILFEIKFGSISKKGRERVNFISNLRKKTKEHIKNVFSTLGYDKSSFIQAITIGDTGELSKEIRMLFSETGTAHLLAISGLHISMLIGGIISIFPFRKIISKIVFFPLLLLYGLILGDKPPIWRVIGIYIYLLIAFIFRREEDSLNALFWVAFINLLISPLKFFNLSFQLSYMAMLGLLFKPNFEKFLPDFWQGIWESSFWLFIFLAPLNIFYFKKLYPLSIVSNLFAIPLFYLILLIAFVSILLSFLPISFLLTKILSLLLDILFLGLQIIISHYKISLIISIFIIILPLFLKKRRDYELLGI